MISLKSNDVRNICIYGVGGVGGYFGSLIAEKFHNQHNVYFIARGDHKEAICRGGLLLKKAGGKEEIRSYPTICTDSVNDIPVCDIIILCVKEYDLNNAVSQISRIADSDTLILPLLNGVDIYERIRKQLNYGKIFPSCVYVGTHIESPGVISQNGGSCKISIGRDPRFPDFYPELLLEILNRASINFSWEQKVEIAIWTKYMFIASYGLVTAAYNKTLGEILEDEKLSKITNSVMREIKAISEVKNIGLAPDAIQRSFLKAMEFPFETKTSFQRDVESKGKLNESDLFAGTIIRLGEEFAIPTPFTRLVFEALKAGLA